MGCACQRQKVKVSDGTLTPTKKSNATTPGESSISASGPADPEVIYDEQKKQKDQVEKSVKISNDQHDATSDVTVPIVGGPRALTKKGGSRNGSLPSLSAEGFMTGSSAMPGIQHPTREDVSESKITAS